VHLEAKSSELSVDDWRCLFNVFVGGEEIGAIINIMKKSDIKMKAFGVSSLTREFAKWSGVREMVKLERFGS